VVANALNRLYDENQRQKAGEGFAVGHHPALKLADELIPQRIDFAVHFTDRGRKNDIVCVERLEGLTEYAGCLGGHARNRGEGKIRSDWIGMETAGAPRDFFGFVADTFQVVDGV